LLVLILFFLLLCAFGTHVNASITMFSDVVRVEKNNSTTQKATDAVSSGSIKVDQTIAGSFQENLTRTIQGGGRQLLQISPLSSSGSFTRHIMCRGDEFDSVRMVINPVDPTTIFRPSDAKAECLTTVSITNKIEFRWYYRSNSSKTWVSCYNWTQSRPSGNYQFVSWLNIVGYWPAYHYPRAYKVDVHLDDSSSPSFSEFFEVTNGGLNSPRMCEYVDGDGNPVNMKSRFTINKDAEAHHYLKFEKIAYFNDELGYCHNFTTVWIQPNNSTYTTYSGNFTDYKDTNPTWNYWEYNYTRDDYISINSSTPVGNWKVEVYLDRYFNSTWMRYGPIATTPFIIGNASVADWTFMVYLDADVNITWTEKAGIDTFLKMASVGSSSQVNIVVQMDRIPGYNQSYGGWTDCKRFYVTKDMEPTFANSIPWIGGGEKNMGDPATLKDFVNWTINTYPANYYFLVLWNHGAGCMGLCFDSTSNGDSLSLPELSQALSGLPVIMDVVLLDACSMSMTEVAYQIKDYVNVVVGPEGLGWSPAPYDDYLSRLTSNPSMLPSAFAEKVVTDYIDWCKLPQNAVITNATMSATDLTKITGLMAAIDDFALKLNATETPTYLSLLLASHEQIIQARNRTEVYPGPYAGQFGYYIDLYHFAQLINQSVLNEELLNSARQVMNALSIGNAIITEADKSLPNSHGLAIFFPDEKAKYDTYGSDYEKTAFAKDTPWDEFVKYHLSGYVLTIKTPYPFNVTVKVAEKSFTTDRDGKIRVFVEPRSYAVNVSTPVLTGAGSRGVFKWWNDNHQLTNPSRTITVTGSTTYTADYEMQYEVTFSQSGVGTDFSETVVTIDNKTGYKVTSLPVFFWWNQSTSHTFAFQSPLIVTPSAKRYIWNSTSALSSLQSDSITVSTFGNITGNYKTQYYLTMSTNFGTFNPSNGWHEAGESIAASVTSPVSGPTGTRYVCTGWTGTGSVSASGTTASVAFTINAPSSIAWNWKTQYLLTIRTDPAGLSPQPNISPQGPWYDNGTVVNCTAQIISGYAFDHWTVDGASWERDVNLITFTMERACEAIAHYTRVRSLWETLLSPDVLQVILGFTGTVLTVAFVGATWVRTRRRKGLVKAFLNEIDDVYSRFKTDPEKCEGELYRLRNTILAGVTDGKISQENYEILDKKIDKHMEEISKQKGRT